MKTFQYFLKEQQEEIKNFLSQYGLEDDWKTFRNRSKEVIAPPEHPKGWKASEDEPLRELNRIINTIINSTQKVNRFGIESISFEKISEEKISTGVQLNLECSGITSARNISHIKKQLIDLIDKAKTPLAKYGISLQILYNKLDASETSVKEATSMDEPAVGLVKKWSFRVICAAIIKSN
jgi:hypothetical protein